MPRLSRCTSPTCPDKVFFLRNEKTNRPMPINSEPDLERGNIRVNFDNSTCTVLSRDDAPIARANGEQLYLSHFVTCPDAKAFRKSA